MEKVKHQHFHKQRYSETAKMAELNLTQQKFSKWENTPTNIIKIQNNSFHIF